MFVGIHRHYQRVSESLEITPEEIRPHPFNHTVVVLVGRVHKGVIQALAYARSLRPEHLIALYVSHDDEDAEEISQQWRAFGINVDLEIKHSRYRELAAPIIEYLDELDQRWHNDTITVVVPEFVVGKWYEHLLHNQSALFLKGRLLFREGTVVTSVPYHVHAEEKRMVDRSALAATVASDEDAGPAEDPGKAPPGSAPDTPADRADDDPPEPPEPLAEPPTDRAQAGQPGPPADTPRPAR
jgi:hypothetical protein